MAGRSAQDIVARWPVQSREAAQLVIEKYGEPDEATDSLLIWYDVGPWKRVVASREYWQHDFPAPHIDAVESVIDYRVPVEKHTPLAEFDGSVIVERTTGEVSARCHDEEANNLALNLMHDIVIGAKSVEEARRYYAHEFLAYRKGEPTPYMDDLRIGPQRGVQDADRRVLSDDDLRQAKEEGEGRKAA